MDQLSTQWGFQGLDKPGTVLGSVSVVAPVSVMTTINWYLIRQEMGSFAT